MDESGEYDPGNLSRGVQTQDSTDGGPNAGYRTEGVVRGFMCQLYSQWHSRQEYDDSPFPHEFNTSTANDSIGIEIGRRLAYIGDDIYEKHGSEMDYMIQRLNPNKDNVFTVFSTIANRLISDGISWGRILILLCFGFRLLTRALRDHIGHAQGSVATIISTIVQVFIIKKITDWITQNGGWRAALNFNPSASNLAMSFVAVTALTSVAAVMYLKLS